MPKMRVYDDCQSQPCTCRVWTVHQMWLQGSQIVPQRRRHHLFLGARQTIGVNTMFERIRQWFKERKRCPRWRECKNFSEEKAVCSSDGSWTHVGTANHERCFSSRSSRQSRPSRQLNKVPSHQEMEIAKRNRERQQNTLGYGLKSRNFRPRPHFEKKLYDLTKKPAEDD